MSRLDTETKRKLREMNAGELLEAIDTQDETLSISLTFEDRLRLVVDDAYASFTHAKVTGLIRRPEIPPLCWVIGGRAPAFPYRARWQLTVQPSLVAARGEPRYQDADLFDHGGGLQEIQRPVQGGIQFLSCLNGYDETIGCCLNGHNSFPSWLAVFPAIVVNSLAVEYMAVISAITSRCPFVRHYRRQFSVGWGPLHEHKLWRIVRAVELVDDEAQHERVLV